MLLFKPGGHLKFNTMKTFSLYLIVALIISSCNKDISDSIELNCSYLTYSTDSFERVHKHLITNSTLLPSFFYPDRYLYSDPVFNPCNPYEIAYLRFDTLTASGCDNELWKFSFCTGKAEKLTEQVCYSPDWSTKGWIIFTGTDRQLWKIEANGDSLVQLTHEAGFNNHAKWSPDGKLYVYTNQNGMIAKEDGEVIQVIDIDLHPLAWLDNTTILGSNLQGTVSYDLFTKETKVLHQANPTGTFPFDNDNLELYCTYDAGTRADKDDYWIRYNLKDNSTDSLKVLFDSYWFGKGDYSPEGKKAVVQLFRENWKDSTSDEIYQKKDLIIMNIDGTEERLIQLPE